MKSTATIVIIHIQRIAITLQYYHKNNFVPSFPENPKLVRKDMYKTNDFRLSHHLKIILLNYIDDAIVIKEVGVHEILNVWKLISIIR